MINVDWVKVAHALRLILEERRMSRQKLADDAKVSRKTIDRLLTGSALNIETLRKLETALSAKLHEDDRKSPSDQDVPTLPHGALGTFFMTRRSFDSVGRIILSALHIDKRPREVVFNEFQVNVGPDQTCYEYRFTGGVECSSTSSNLQLTTTDEGLLRVLSLSRPAIGHLNDGQLVARMRGVLLAFNEVQQFGAVYPVVSPVFLESANMGFDKACGDALLGSYDQDAPEVAYFAGELDRTEQIHVASKGVFKGTIPGIPLPTGETGASKKH
ncbi:helix-turn-helix transcriptional regulator [Sedimentitalea sp.]|uniref:helix-turn-helix domain-containing protein n=1 Tax=Sedimentitalea sp. TaxID=2048915 RepID=UPI003299F619